MVILSALNLESRAIREHLDITRTIPHPAGTRFAIGSISETRHRVALAVTGTGNQAMAVLAERAVGLFRPEALILVGIAGALRSDIRLGDVVVATRVYGYHSGRAEVGGFLCIPRSWEASHELCQLALHVDLTTSWSERLAENMNGETRPHVHFGSIAAGEVILNSSSSALSSHLRRSYSDAIAVEMESAGLMQAGHLNQSLPALAIRGISDYADGSTDITDVAGWQHTAAANAAAFAAAVVKTLVSELTTPSPPWRADRESRMKTRRARRR